MANSRNNGTEIPELTTTIRQEFFIEPEGGPQTADSYLELFPETLYSHSLDTNLAALLYALLGPAGVASVSREFLEARLLIEHNGLQTVDLDFLYANPFSFARLASESYKAETNGLLPVAEWEEIQKADAAYKSRAQNYLAAIRAGGTLLGMKLAAASGLNRSTEVIENFRYLFDSHSDKPLGLTKYGLTDSTEEIIIIPRQELPKNQVQSIKFISEKGGPGYAERGTYQLSLPRGPGESAASKTEQNNTTTIPLQPQTSAFELQTALENVHTIGKGNVYVSGNPTKLEVTFIGELADQALPFFVAVNNTLEDLEGHKIRVEVEQLEAGVGVEDESASIPTEDWYYAQVAIDNLKPMTTIPTPGKSPSLTKRIITYATSSDSEFVQVVRYVTGRSDVKWPATNSELFIEAGKEREAPLPKEGQQQHYTNFHNIASASAYFKLSEAESSATSESPNVHVGPYSEAQSLLFPFLAGWGAHLSEYTAKQAYADPPALLHLSEENLVEGYYSLEYINTIQKTETKKGKKSKHIRSPAQTTPFWSSQEEAEGTDYLLLDLGGVQAVNFISMDVTNKPYQIGVYFDLLDQNPTRLFEKAVTKNPLIEIGNNITPTNSWVTISEPFNNAVGSMIYTRFILLEFARVVGGAFTLELTGGRIRSKGRVTHSPKLHNYPFSIEVRNLRIGRSVS